ncbi:MAG: apolipoprotein N-acyltransferase [Planctomycetes bacterium]|nr:apolipoprotein N-acyltransferase [Planctomycetota bacterium]
MLKPVEFEAVKKGARWKVWALVLSSGVLMTLSQPPFDVPGLGLIMLAPLFIVLPHMRARGAMLAGFIVGMLYFWIDMWWLGQMVTDPDSEWIVFAMFAFVATAMAVYYGVCAMVIRWLLTRRAKHAVWLVPLVWLGFEFIHEFNTPAPYPWMPIGVSITEFTWFIQTADIWGTYGLSAALAFTSLGVASLVRLDGEEAKFKLVRTPFRRYVLPGAALLFVGASCVYGAIRVAQIEASEVDDGPVIAGVQANLSQEVKVRNDPLRLPTSYRDHLDLSRQAADDGAELILWAETMVFYGASRDGLTRGNEENSAKLFVDGVPREELLGGSVKLPDGTRHMVSYIENLRAMAAYDFRTPMLVGVLTDIPDDERTEDWKRDTYDLRKYNTAMMIDAQGRVAATYDKRYLVPGGEYIPLEDVGFIREVIIGYAEGLQGYASRVERGKRETLFRLPSKSERLQGRDWAFTSSICYEYAWPGCYVELHEKPDRYPDFHVNISNEGWFNQSAELDQAVDYLRLRAIESRVPIVRGTNTGVTCTIDATGRVRDRLVVDGKDREVAGLLLMKPPVLESPKPTLFVSMVGRGLGYLSLVVILGIIPLMITGRAQLYWRRRRAKVAEIRQTKKIEKE